MELKCLEKIIELKSLFEKNYRGNLKSVCSILYISERSFFRYKKILEEVYSVEIKYNRKTDQFYLNK